MALQKNPGPPLTSIFRGLVDNIPPRWRSRLGITRVVQKQPLDIELTELGNGVVASQLVQELTDERTKTDTTISDPTGEVLVEYIRTKDGQVGTRTVKLVPAGSVLPTFTELTIDAGQENLGNGWSEQMVVTTPNLFGGNDYSIELRDVVPPEFTALLPMLTAEQNVVGIATLPTLGAGEWQRREAQVTEQYKRVTVRYRDILGLPKTIVDRGITEQFGGATTTITKTLALDAGLPTVLTGLMVIKSEINRLGNGISLRVTETAEGGSWSSLDGQDYDERFSVLIPYTKQVKVPGAGLGTALTEITPIDIWRQQNKTIDIDAVAEFLDAYSLSYFGKVNIDMPDRLVSVSSTIATDRGEGASNETGTFAVTGSYSVSQSLRATAQSSSTMIPEVIAVIKQFWGNNIGCTNYHFFLPSPVTPAAVHTKIVALVGGPVTAWPKFNPEMVSLIIIGGRTSVQATASSQGSSAASSSGTSSTSGGGTGWSKEQGLTVKSMRISPTIHGAITVSGITSDSDSVSATSTAEATGLGPTEAETQSSTVNSSVSPTSIPATDGATNWPTTGKYLLRVDAQPYRFGYIQIHAVVVDAADFPINP